MMGQPRLFTLLAQAFSLQNDFLKSVRAAYSNNVLQTRSKKHPLVVDCLGPINAGLVNSQLSRLLFYPIKPQLNKAGISTSIPTQSTVVD